MKPADGILFSGGAPGAEAQFGACAERHGWNAVADHPVRIQAAIGGADVRCSADGGYGLDRAFDHRQVLFHAERIIVGLGLELDAAGFSLRVGELFCKS